jgi:hypothetical protein
MTTRYTRYFRLNLPDFRYGPWHDLVNEDFIKIDELLLTALQGVNVFPWKNDTHYDPGITVIDSMDGTVWVARVSHTSAPFPTTFAEDRDAHFGYWTRVVAGIVPRGEWTNDTDYLPNDMVTVSAEGIIAVCVEPHHSVVFPGTIRDDSIYWSFLADLNGYNMQAKFVRYDNTVSLVEWLNLQDTTDDLFKRMLVVEELTGATDPDASGGLRDDIDALEVRMDAVEARLTAIEAKNLAQDNAITALQNKDTALDNRIKAIEDAIAGGEIGGSSIVFSGWYF